MKQSNVVLSILVLLKQSIERGRQPLPDKVDTFRMGWDGMGWDEMEHIFHQ